MACPFFMPTHKYEDGTWLHPFRLPLGGGWKGYCTAPGREGEVPSPEQLHHACNLGYARSCERHPAQYFWDSIRFAVKRESDQRILLCYVCERDHRPGEDGVLEYDASSGRWTVSHRDFRIQKMAECYLESYLLRKNGSAVAS
ncbi:MAG TPA: hypothetical protein VJX16_17145 [Terriglobales bacterium]|nr:hypothetical protein [Terriglobales bacterium]